MKTFTAFKKIEILTTYVKYDNEAEYYMYAKHDNEEKYFGRKETSSLLVQFGN